MQHTVRPICVKLVVSKKTHSALLPKTEEQQKLVGAWDNNTLSASTCPAVEVVRANVLCAKHAFRTLMRLLDRLSMRNDESDGLP